MKKLMILGTMLILLCAFISFGQSKNADPYKFLDKSKEQITQIWGDPEKVDIDKLGYVLWHYSHSTNVDRIFYFSNNYVEIAKDIIYTSDNEYATNTETGFVRRFKIQGFWEDSHNKSVIIVTNGKVNIDITIIGNRIIIIAYNR